MDNEKRHEVLCNAIIYAAEMHKGTNRKGTAIPYIVHCMEAAAIAAGLTADAEVIAAAVLHDTVEDTAADIEDIRGRFGERIAELVGAESENKREGLPEEETWELRKQETLDHLSVCGDRDVLMIAIADKLSNLRAMHRDYMNHGDELWERFNQKDPSMQKWYYESMGKIFAPLEGTQAYMEYAELLEKVFGQIPERFNDHFDQLEFRLMDPVEAQEEWAVQFGADELSVEIRINGAELAEQASRLEKGIPRDRPVDLNNCDYGHMKISLLYRYLSGELEDEYGIPLLWCRDCGVPECDSVRCSIRTEDDCVIWEKFTKNGRKPIGEDLRFRFSKDNYQEQLEFLKKHCSEERQWDAMEEYERAGGLVEETIPFGSGEFDYDDVTEDLYDAEEDAKLERELQKIAENAKVRIPQ